MRRVNVHVAGCRRSLANPGKCGKPDATIRRQLPDRMQAMRNPFEQDLGQNAANFAVLTPLSFIDRTASIWPEQVAVIHGSWRADLARNLRALAGVSRRRLRRCGVGIGDTVSCMLANTPEMVELHFGVPMTGGVLNTLNTRLDAEAIAFMLEHGEAKVLVTDTEFAPTVRARAGAAARQAARHRRRRCARPRGDRSGGAARRMRLRGVHRGRRPGVRVAAARRRVAVRSRSTTRRAPPAIRRVSSITTAARTSTRSRTSSTGACRVTPSTCGRCRCSTATAGASRGRWPRSPARTSACAGSRRRRSSMRSARTRSRTTAARRSCIRR